MAGFLWYPNDSGINPSIWQPGGPNSHYVCSLAELADPVYLHTLPITIAGVALDTSVATSSETYYRYLFNGNSELAYEAGSSLALDAPNVLNLSGGNLSVTTVDEETTLDYLDLVAGTTVYEYPEAVLAASDLTADNECLVVSVQFAIFEPLVASAVVINFTGISADSLYIHVATDGFGANSLYLGNNGQAKLTHATQLLPCTWYEARVVIPGGFHATADIAALQVTNLSTTVMTEVSSTTALSGYDATDVSVQVQYQSTAPGAIRLASVQLAAFLEVGV